MPMASIPCRVSEPAPSPSSTLPGKPRMQRNVRSCSSCLNERSGIGCGLPNSWRSATARCSIRSRSSILAPRGGLSPGTTALALWRGTESRAKTPRQYQVGGQGARPASASRTTITHGRLASPFTAREVYRNEWTGLTEPRIVQGALEGLEELGWIRAEAMRARDGGRPTVRFRINPRRHDRSRRVPPEASESPSQHPSADARLRVRAPGPLRRDRGSARGSRPLESRLRPALHLRDPRQRRAAPLPRVRARGPRSDGSRRVNYDDLLESLTDYFSRQHHSADVARSRAESVVCIVQAHAEGDDALSETVRRFMVPPDWLGPRLSGL